MDIYELSGKLGHTPRKKDGMTISYQEQCAYIAGCLDVWFSLLYKDRTTAEEIADVMRMNSKEVQRMYIMWLNSYDK